MAKSGVIAAVGQMMIAFGAVAAFRVAQESRGALQVDLARRGQSEPPRSGQRPVTVVDTPGPHIAPPAPLPVVEVRTAPIGVAVPDTPLAAPVALAPVAAAPAEAIPPAAAEPVGGPLAAPEPARSDASRSAEQAKRLAAKKTREARIARERKAAARRAARAKQAQPAQSFSSGFGNSNLGGGFERK